LLAFTFISLALIKLGLFLLSFHTLLKFLAKINQPKLNVQIVNKVSVSKIIWAINVATKYMPGSAKCLARALTTAMLMSRYRHPCNLRIGVTKGEGGQLEAHAWIEYDGKVAIGYLANLERYVQLPSLPVNK
jgi:Transglutaminase-like superfamily